MSDIVSFRFSILSNLLPFSDCFGYAVWLGFLLLTEAIQRFQSEENALNQPAILWDHEGNSGPFGSIGRI